ncbi:hypothetical protein SAMN05660841_04272 [Sphingobacterium nematocida]|uniref:HTH cro/C1-type domain-containing protein n=1 Tax=Sphingobacterium nematocida TaxID=1513896 RepID=A0A1T5GQQ5_9SPHI|nr:helix-turn-helix transcriptional regulator [Sphingobacterium nematocida]SKC10660.1 hypothetical protein SAMN05660841_04272 [Sphingobacterium nematocida]
MKNNTKIQKLIEPHHSIANYINNRLESLNWTVADLAVKSTISQGEISKILTGARKGLKADVFYKIYTAFGDSCVKASKIVYADLDLKLQKYKPKERNTFGTFMEQFETTVNSLEEISVKTGIDENRLKDLYFRKGSLEAYEMLLIEKAIGKKPGELFANLYLNS